MFNEQRPVYYYLCLIFKSLDFFISLCRLHIVKQAFKIILTLFLFTVHGKAQVLYYQGTYKGGVSFDGKEYFATNWISSDTIYFQNSVPIGCTLKKAFLIGFRFTNYSLLQMPTHDNPLFLNYNSQIIRFDSSNIATPVFYADPLSMFMWMSVKDVTSLTQNNNNTLITPFQSGNSDEYQYDGFYLLMLYENNTYSTINVVLFLNDISYFNSTTNYQLNNLNPINTANDVGLSIESTNDDLPPFMQYQLASSTNTVTLGTLRQVDAIGNPLPNGLGTFHYENGILSGLLDDSPDAFIDSTDALANIKSYLANSTTSFTLTATNPPNQQSRNMTNAFILAYSTPCPPLPQGADTTKNYKLCSIHSTQLNANAGYATYNWSPTNSLSNPTIANPVASPTASTNYICTITDNNGCVHTEQASVLIHTQPTTPDTITLKNAVCGMSKGSMTLTQNLNHYGYTYSLNNGASQVDTVFTNLSAGIYTLTSTDNYNCSYTSTFTITETNPAIATFSYSPAMVCVNEAVNFTNTSNTNQLCWHFASTDSSNLQNPTYIFSDTGIYNVTLISWINLRECSDTVNHLVYVKECPSDSLSITAPNIFTPNSDDINDTWLPIVFNRGYTISEFSIAIFDRWGVNVYGTDLEKDQYGWDGHTISGMECVEGTYYYVLKYKARSSTGEEKKGNLKGFLQLIR